MPWTCRTRASRRPPSPAPMIVTGVAMVVSFRTGTLFQQLVWNNVPASVKPTHLVGWNDVPYVSRWVDDNQNAASGAARGPADPGAHRRVGDRAAGRRGPGR